MYLFVATLDGACTETEGDWREGESDREIGRDGEKGKRVDRKVERE